MSFSVVCWKWRPYQKNYRSNFTSDAVNVLKSMTDRHLKIPHRFICVTDDPVGIDPSVEVLPLWTDYSELESPHGDKNPSCYRRLRLFHPEASTWFGDRFVSLDLDTLIVNDITPLVDVEDDFKIWGDTGPRSIYNGSMILLSAGARPQVWNDFDPEISIDQAFAAGYWGSDQAWISYCLGKGEKRWSEADGVYSYRNHFRIPGKRDLPSNARIVFFHGANDPWENDVHRRHIWVKEHYY